MPQIQDVVLVTTAGSKTYKPTSVVTGVGRLQASSADGSLIGNRQLTVSGRFTTGRRFKSKSTGLIPKLVTTGDIVSVSGVGSYNIEFDIPADYSTADCTELLETAQKAIADAFLKKVLTGRETVFG